MARKKGSASHQSKAGGQYAVLPHSIMDSPAYRAMSLEGRQLLLELVRRFNGHNNGRIALAHRDARILLGCGARSVGPAFAQLEQHGFIVMTSHGDRGARLAREYRLTWITYGAAPPYRDATNEYRVWSPPVASETVVDHQKRRSTVVAEQPVSATTVVTDYNSPVTTVEAGEKEEWRNSATTVPATCHHSGDAYNIPYPPAPADPPSQGGGGYGRAVDPNINERPAVLTIDEEIAARLTRGGRDAEALARMDHAEQRKAVEALRRVLARRPRTA